MSSFMDRIEQGAEQGAIRGAEQAAFGNFLGQQGTQQQSSGVVGGGGGWEQKLEQTALRDVEQRFEGGQQGQQQQGGGLGGFL